MNPSAKILFGPYGTRLDEMSSQRGLPGLSDPVSILNGPDYRNALSELAENYLRVGALVAATNTFRLRLRLLTNTQEGRTIFSRVLAAHMGALRDAISRTTREDVMRVVSLGPGTEHCYHPEHAPARKEAYEFHSMQAYEAGRVEAQLAWFETVSTIEEAIGIAQAAAHHRTLCLISFVIDHDGNLLSGENPLDAIRAVDAATCNFPYGYGFNCCPVEGIPRALEKLGDLVSRVKALYPNASSLPQRTALEGLSSSTGHVIGVRDPDGLAKYLNHLAQKYRIEIIGGCCGFGTEDVSKIVSATREELSQEALPLTDFPRSIL